MKLSIISLPFITVAYLFTASCAKDPEQRPSPLDYSRTKYAKSEGKRTLCVFMDGTANDYNSHTNIRRLYELISARRDPKILCYYDYGVGANELPLSGMIGGAGFSKNISQAYTFLSQHYDKGRGDEIFIFGYSRGARQAQVLCDLLNESGIRPSSSRESNYRTGDSLLFENRKIFGDYKKQRERKAMGEKVASLASQNGWHRPTIKFVGLFDCVESMANNVWRKAQSGNLKEGSYRDHKYYPYTIPVNVQESYHALALDEKRGLYEGIEWVRPANAHKGQIIEQVWFSGSHGDTGGGYENSQSLSAYSLNWMIGKLDKHKLIPGRIRMHTELETPVNDSSQFTIAGKLLSHIRSDKPRYLQLWTDPFENSNYPGSIENACRCDVRPLVHQSVIERMKRNPLAYSVRTKLEANSLYRPSLFQKYYDHDRVDFKRLSRDIQIVPITR